MKSIVEVSYPTSTVRVEPTADGKALVLFSSNGVIQGAILNKAEVGGLFNKLTSAIASSAQDANIDVVFHTDDTVFGRSLTRTEANMLGIKLSSVQTSLK